MEKIYIVDSCYIENIKGEIVFCDNSYKYFYDKENDVIMSYKDFYNKHSFRGDKIGYFNFTNLNKQVRSNY